MMNEAIEKLRAQQAKVKIVTADGKVVSAEVTNDLDTATGIGYVFHWATCPKALDYKRGK